MTDWRAHAGRLAWPTMAMALVVVASHVAVDILALRGTLPLWAAFGINVVLAYLAFTPMHEASHGNVAGKVKRLGWLDDAFGWAMSLILAAPYPAFRVLHLRHHAKTNDPDQDPDFHVASARKWAVLLRCATIMPAYYREFLFGETARSRAGTNTRRVTVTTLGLLISLTVALSWAGYGAYVLALWWGPALVGTGILAFVFDWLPHQPHDVQGRYLDTRVILGPGLTALTCAQNYHLIHHLYPRVPFYNYPVVFEQMRPELEDKGSEIVVLGRR